MQERRKREEELEKERQEQRRADEKLADQQRLVVSHKHKLIISALFEDE